MDIYRYIYDILCIINNSICCGRDLLNNVTRMLTEILPRSEVARPGQASAPAAPLEPSPAVGKWADILMVPSYQVSTLDTLHLSLCNCISLLLSSVSSQSHLRAGLAFPSVEYGEQSDITKSTVDSERVNTCGSQWRLSGIWNVDVITCEVICSVICFQVETWS